MAGAERPGPLRLQHVALEVADLERSEHFYREVLGLRVVWRPDPANVYLTSGADNLALHRAEPGPRPEAGALDHIGFALEREEAVDAWHDFLRTHDVPIESPPRTHRDGARSFYCRDPDGNRVQLLFEPRLQEGE